MLFITPELKHQQQTYHQKMMDTPKIQHYWASILKYPLFDNAFLFIILMFPFFTILSYKYLIFFLPIPATILFSYLTAILIHTSNGYALPPRSDLLLTGFFIKVILMIGSPAYNKKQKQKQKLILVWELSSFYVTIQYLATRLLIETEDKMKLGQQAAPNAVRLTIFVICGIIILTLSTYYLPFIAVVLLTFLWLTLLPACLIQIAIDGHILSGFKFKLIHQFIKKIGNEYIWIMLTTLITASLFFNSIFNFSGILFIISLFACLYSFILCFHLMGYFIYHRRHIIDYLAENTPEGHEEIAADKLYEQADAIVQQAKVLITDRGLLKHAFSILTLRLNTAKDDLALHAQVSILLFEWEDKRLALKHAALYLHLLIQQQKYVTAYDILQKSHAQQTDFKLNDAEDYQVFVKYLVESIQDFILILDFIHTFEQNYPKHEDYFAIQLLKAKLFSKNTNFIDAAQSLLSNLLAQPQHPLHGEVLLLAKELLLTKKHDFKHSNN
jgi:hypothetical protein